MTSVFQYAPENILYIFNSLTNRYYAKMSQMISPDFSRPCCTTSNHVIADFSGTNGFPMVWNVLRADACLLFVAKKPVMRSPNSRNRGKARVIKQPYPCYHQTNFNFMTRITSCPSDSVIHWIKFNFQARVTLFSINLTSE